MEDLYIATILIVVATILRPPRDPLDFLRLQTQKPNVRVLQDLLLLVPSQPVPVLFDGL